VAETLVGKQSGLTCLLEISYNLVYNTHDFDHTSIHVNQSACFGFPEVTNETRVQCEGQLAALAGPLDAATLQPVGGFHF